MLKEKLPKEKVLRDPIHNFIHVEDPIILDLINTPEFQRLRRVKQLGITSSVFHGAEHSRFGHSVGVYELARRITERFEQYYSDVWDPKERLLTLVAALLHDIGHGAFSHTFEHLFHTDHEAMTREIITGDTEIHRVLAQVSPDFPNKVASVIAKTYENPQVVQLISSQIDVDRMDYLLRDAYFTGTKYGEFDIDRILRTMQPTPDGIAFDIAGMHAVEDYIVSRYQMYLQVYFHPVSRGMEVLLEHLLQRAQELYRSNTTSEFAENDFVGPLLAPLFSDKKLTLSEYLKLDDNVFMTYINIWQSHSDPILSDLSQRFMGRRPLKSMEITDETAPLLEELEQLVDNAGFNPRFYTARNNAYDLPYDDYKPNVAKPRTQIDFLLADGSHRELSDMSTLVAAIKGKASIDQRFFFPKEMLNIEPNELFADTFKKFRSFIRNNALTTPNPES
ncbi:MAG: HD domain-containing protein [Leuconostoc mesenteroides]|uniref:HD domain protein n=1 Tax=Leuconostoc mesenteroides subsp. cremoris ATCC 19254 TaxID=586220 RepID=C2KLB1_LEUMC|nr:HD domain-containing protein [Leuconostoc mesenteroides]KDA52476.1 Deoxyguanosinetriphosphate triphosphohydrolase [Leuconostoc mesenteroides subsp. cremoris T26]EEJ41976.1 HD domain protein [Leuconostoc mesenteroides subsp. cremoris ATCC 19254]MCP9302991.1 HD domain-containing protein [Leuconostoc mesenteroides]MCP9327386.1 HD domain-containing protein [Leuconostoc mesenteroides]MCT3039002.1 HD domain-containing protein [Leuconostoc mesenteroides]